MGRVKTYGFIMILCFLAIAGVIVYLKPVPVSITKELFIRVENLQMEGDSFYSLNGDPQILLKHDQGIKNIQLDIVPLTGERIACQVYYSKGSPQFSEENSIKEELREGKHIIELPSKSQYIRVDIGNKAGEKYSIRSMTLNSDELYYKQVKRKAVATTGYMLVLAMAGFIYSKRKMLIDYLSERVTRAQVLFFLTGIVFISIFLFKLNFASFYCYKHYMPQDASNFEQYTIGKEREIRSDEWGVITPLQLSQGYITYSRSSDRLGEPLNMNAFGGEVPIWDISSIGKIFNWGFLLFGPEIGFSWFYVMRTVFLLIYNYYLFKILTRDERVSIVGGICVALSPNIQWWLTAQPGIPESFIFGPMIFVSMYHIFLKENAVSWRVFNGSLLFIALVGYIFMFYPPSQISMGYLLLFLLVGMYLDRKEEFSFCKANIILLLAAFIMAGVVSALSLLDLRSEIQAISNSVYPGKRFLLGGGIGLEYFYNYFMSLLLPYKGVAYSNSTELSSFITLFPIPLIVWFFSRKNLQNKYMATMLVVYVTLMSIYTFIGVPRFVAQATLMYAVTEGKSVMYLNYAMVVLLFLLFADRKRQLSFPIVAVIFCSFVAIGFKKYIYYLQYISWYLPIAVGVFLLLIYCYNLKRNGFLVGMLCIALIGGVTVNPINFGIGLMTETKLAKEIRSIDQHEPGMWVSWDHWSNTYLLAQGVQTLGAINFPPHIALWRKLDTAGEYNHVYNRYADVVFAVVDEKEGKAKFELLTNNAFRLNLTLQDLRNTGVKYLMAKTLIQDLKCIYKDEVDHIYIYEIIE